MTAQFVTPTAFTEEQLQARALKNARLGLLLWRIANGLVFVFFVFANYLMRSVQSSWPPPGVERLEVGLPIAISVVLVISGVFASRALNAIRRGDTEGMGRNLILTMGLGLVFFIGIVAVCLRIPYSGPYSSIIMTMNVFHALHVVIGAALLAYAFTRRQQYTATNHFTVEGAVVFWHFVDLMWLFFFLVIYVI